MYVRNKLSASFSCSRQSIGGGTGPNNAAHDEGGEQPLRQTDASIVGEGALEDGHAIAPVESIVPLELEAQDLPPS
jgi:hypothetical protein